MMFSVFCCGCSSCEKPHVTSNGVNNAGTTSVVDEKLPEWGVVDSSLLDGYVSYSSANLPMDIEAKESFYPFVVCDKSSGYSLFILFTMKRYDKLYCSQMNISDKDGYAINTWYVSTVKSTDDFECLLFAVDNKDFDFIINHNGNLKINVWGMFGSTSVCLDSLQTDSFSKLVCFVKKQ